MLEWLEAEWLLDKPVEGMFAHVLGVEITGCGQDLQVRKLGSQSLEELVSNFVGAEHAKNKFGYKVSIVLLEERLSEDKNYVVCRMSKGPAFTSFSKYVIAKLTKDELMDLMEKELVPTQTFS